MASTTFKCNNCGAVDSYEIAVDNFMYCNCGSIAYEIKEAK